MTLERISIREYARRNGVTDGAIRKALSDGRIVKGYDRKQGKILPHYADMEWLANRNPSYGNRISTEAAELPKAKPSKGKSSQDTKEAEAPRSAEPIAGSLAHIKKQQAQVALLEQTLNLKRKQGELVNKQQVYGALFSMGQEMRQRLLVIPDRVIDEILSITNRNEAHALLYNAIADALETITDMQNRNLGE